MGIPVLGRQWASFSSRQKHLVCNTSNRCWWSLTLQDRARWIFLQRFRWIFSYSWQTAESFVEGSIKWSGIISYWNILFWVNRRAVRAYFLSNKLHVFWKTCTWIIATLVSAQLSQRKPSTRLLCLHSWSPNASPYCQRTVWQSLYLTRQLSCVESWTRRQLVLSASLQTGRRLFVKAGPCTTYSSHQSWSVNSS